MVRARRVVDLFSRRASTRSIAIALQASDDKGETIEFARCAASMRVDRRRRRVARNARRFDDAARRMEREKAESAAVV